MKCTNCGMEVENGARFCTNCGKTIEQQAPEGVPVNNIQNGQPGVPMQQAPQPNKSNKIVWIIIGVVAGVFVFIAIGIILLATLFAAETKKVIEKQSDIVEHESPIDKDNIVDGKLIKTIKSPTGRQIRIIQSKIHTVTADTEYLYKDAEEKREKYKIMTEEEADKLDSTPIYIMAVKKIISELKYESLSEQQLRETLAEENYPEDAINYAIETVNIDWDIMAEMRAASYMHHLDGVSKKHLVELLVYEKFTEEQAEKAASNKNYDFYEQAVKKVCDYKYVMPKYGREYTRDEIKEQMGEESDIYDGFTKAEIDFALKEVYDNL